MTHVDYAVEILVEDEDGTEKNVWVSPREVQQCGHTGMLDGTHGMVLEMEDGSRLRTRDWIHILTLIDTIPEWFHQELRELREQTRSMPAHDAAVLMSMAFARKLVSLPGGSCEVA